MLVTCLAFSYFIGLPGLAQSFSVPAPGGAFILESARIETRGADRQAFVATVRNLTRLTWKSFVLRVALNHDGFRKTVIVGMNFKSSLQPGRMALMIDTVPATFNREGEMVIDLASGTFLAPREHVVYRGAIAVSRDCVADFAAIMARTGLALRKGIADLVAYGCMINTDAEIEVRVIADRGLPAGISHVAIEKYDDLTEGWVLTRLLQKRTVEVVSWNAEDHGR